MSFGQYARFFGNALLGNIGPIVLFYFAVRFMIGRYAKRETFVRLVLGLLCLFFAISASSVLGNQLVNNYKISLLQNIVPALTFFLVGCIGVQQGALRNYFVGWMHVPTSVEEGRKPTQLEQGARRVG